MSHFFFIISILLFYFSNEIKSSSNLLKQTTDEKVLLKKTNHLRETSESKKTYLQIMEESQSSNANDTSSQKKIFYCILSNPTDFGITDPAHNPKLELQLSGQSTIAAIETDKEENPLQFLVLEKITNDKNNKEMIIKRIYALKPELVNEWNSSEPLLCKNDSAQFENFDTLSKTLGLKLLKMETVKKDETKGPWNYLDAFFEKP